MNAQQRLVPATTSAPAAHPAGAPERVLLVIPCFNEESAVAGLLDEIAACGSYDSLVVDDGSQDATYQVARQRADAVRLAVNLGIGGAVQTGIKYAARNGYAFCAQIDGDGQHPPAEIARLLAAYEASRCNIIIGTRYGGTDSFRSTRARRLGGRVIAWALCRLFRSAPITDPTSGMRLMDRAAIEFFAKKYPQDFPEPISLAWALRSGLTVGEAPVQMRPRQGGTSSIAGLKPLAYMIRVLGYIVLTRIARAS